MTSLTGRLETRDMRGEILVALAGVVRRQVEIARQQVAGHAGDGERQRRLARAAGAAQHPVEITKAILLRARRRAPSGGQEEIGREQRRRAGHQVEAERLEAEIRAFVKAPGITDTLKSMSLPGR